MFGFFNKNKQTDTPQQEENATPTSYDTTRVGLARHAVEQEMLVEYFSKNPTALIDDITEEYGLATVFGNMYRAQKLHRSPYYADQYALDMKKTEFDDYLIIAELPKPEHLGLCYRLFFTFDAPFEHVALFMVEREEHGAALYRWDREKNRTAVGFVETGPWDEKTKEERAAELQMVSDAFHDGWAPQPTAGHEPEPEEA